MKWKEGGQFENPPAGSHIARCVQLVDLGTQSHSFAGEQWTSRDVRLTFELPEELMEGKYNPEVKGKPFAVSMTVKQSLHPSSKLRPLLESWRGRKFTKEELAAYDPKKIISAPCRLTLIENGDYINIDGISPLIKSGGKTEACPAQVNPSIYFSLEPDEFNVDTFNKLTEKTQEKIKLTPEWAALFSNKPTSEASAKDDAADSGEMNSPGFDPNEPPF